MHYKQIIAGLMAFAFILFIPFAAISYVISQKNISASIDFSNNLVLSQLNTSYSALTDTVSALCMDIFLNNNAQQFLYSQDFTYSDISNYMRSLIDTAVISNSSIDSIVLYNGRRNEWFSTKNTDPPTGQELQAFLKTQESVPRLQPIFRQITQNQGNFQIQTYVFSYFMYQFADPTSGSDSYIVVNQNAGWFIDNLRTILRRRDYASSIYWINDTGIIYSNSVNTQGSVDSFLIDDFYKSHIYSGETMYTQKYNGKKYLLSSIQLGTQRNYLIFILKYDEVFRDLINLRHDYIIFGAFFLLAIVAMLIPFSRRIYSPVRKYEPIFEQYQLSHLIADSSPENYEQFKKNLPEHWISREIDGTLCIVLIKIEHRDDAKDEFENETAHSFPASIIRMMIPDFFDKVPEFAFLAEDSEHIGLIVHLSPEKTEKDTLQPFFIACIDTLKQHLNTGATISHSPFFTDILSLDKMYHKAEEYLQYRFVFGSGLVISEKDCRINLENREPHYPFELDEKLVSALNEKNMPLVIVALEDIKNVLYHFKYTNISICIMELVNTVVRTVSRFENNTASIQASDALYKKMISSEFMDDFFFQLGEYIRLALGANEESGRDARNSINEILDFVQNNYADPNLSSQMIGDFLGKSNRYVMFKFMESIGKPLNEHIRDVRMKKAANLLKNTELPINEIASKIGIENENYFYKLFKKVYTVTPREFSKKYRLSP
jgi:AraC-like DNA-binding protein